MGNSESLDSLYHSQVNEHFRNYNLNNVNYKIDCCIHPNYGMNEYICKLDVNISNTIPPEFIFIVDKSGSMGSKFNYIITKTIPEVLNKLGYKDMKIHLITFDSNVNYFCLSQSELSGLNVVSGGQTYMSGIYRILKIILEIGKEKCKHIRILTISDGILADHEQTKREGELLYKDYKDVFKINSQCIRINNSGGADTEGIISTLKFNNVKKCNLVEYTSNDLNNLAQIIIKLFIDDGLSGNALQVSGDNVKLKNNPWEENCSNSQPLSNGQNIFFTDKNKPLYVVNKDKNSPINSKKGVEVNTDNYESIVGKEKINNIFQKIKMNKVLNTNESNTENINITNYFKNLSNKTKRENKYDNNLDYLVEEINYINNDKTIYGLNQDQKADYIENLSNINRLLEMKSLKKDNKKMKKQIEEILCDNKKLNDELEKLKIRMAEMDKKFNEMETNNHKIKETLNQNKKEIKSFRKDLDDIKFNFKLREIEQRTDDESYKESVENTDNNSDKKSGEKNPNDLNEKCEEKTPNDLNEKSEEKTPNDLNEKSEEKTPNDLNEKSEEKTPNDLNEKSEEKIDNDLNKKSEEKIDNDLIKIEYDLEDEKEESNDEEN